MDRGADIHAVSGIKFTPLYIVAKKGFPNTVKSIVKTDAGFYAVEKAKVSPLHMAA